jgi:hypothetical protein
MQHTNKHKIQPPAVQHVTVDALAAQFFARYLGGAYGAAGPAAEALLGARSMVVVAAGQTKMCRAGGCAFVCTVSNSG